MAPSGPGISTADGTPKPCWGPITRAVASGGHSFRAKVTFPILGANFLEHFDMWMDLKRRKLCRWEPLADFGDSWPDFCQLWYCGGHFRACTTWGSCCQEYLSSEGGISVKSG